MQMLFPHGLIVQRLPHSLGEISKILVSKELGMERSCRKKNDVGGGDLHSVPLFGNDFCLTPNKFVRQAVHT